MRGLESLIDFIFANLAFLLILLGGLVSLFKRRSADEQSQQRTNQPEQHEPVFDWPGAERESERETEEPRDVHAEQSFEHNANPFLEKLEEVKDIRDISNYRRSDKEVKVERQVSSKPITKKVKKPFDANRSSVVQGMIWSQILDEPRSKKKHSLQNNIYK